MFKDRSIYQERGFKNRKDYLEQLAIEYDVDIYAICAIAQLLDTFRSEERSVGKKCR